MERIKLAIERAKASGAQHQDGAANPGRPSAGTRPVGHPSATSGTADRAPGGPAPLPRRSQAPWWALLAAALVGVGYWLATRSDARPPAPAPVVSAPVAPAPVTAATAPVALAAAAMPAVAAAAAVPATPVPAEPSREVLAEEVEAAVERWRQAWSSRDMVGYLAAYSDTFVPADGTTRDAWVTGRYRNVGGREAIGVTVRNLNVESVDPTRARVSFVQDYVSGDYREMNRPKTLDLARSPEGRWQIIAEWQGKEKAQR